MTSNLSKSLTNKLLNTQIDVITLDDNLTHPYFNSISWSKDNYTTSPGSAIIVMPYLKEVFDYWSKYTGIVVISAELSNSKTTIFTFGEEVASAAKSVVTPQERVNREKLGYEEIKYNDAAKKNATNFYNYSFIGRVTKINLINKEAHILLHDLGWKFSQKVPRKFRDNYISNQTLGDAFQAMCEFMGIDFAYSIEDLEELTFAEDGYSVKKDGEIIEDVPSLFKEWGKNDEEEDSSNLDDQSNETPGLMEINQKLQENNSSNPVILNNIAFTPTTSTNTINNSTQSTDENTDENIDKEDNQQSITDKINKYQAEFDEKIKNLFIGNKMYDSDLTSNVMDYGAITITPKSSSSDSSMSSVGGSSSTSSTSGTPYWEKEGFSSQASYDLYQARKNSNGYSYYIQTRDRGWQKVIYRRYIAAMRNGWVVRMDKGSITGKAKGSTKPLWKYVLKL